jgi:hypothetical protein
MQAVPLSTPRIFGVRGQSRDVGCDPAFPGRVRDYGRGLALLDACPNNQSQRDWCYLGIKVGRLALRDVCPDSQSQRDWCYLDRGQLVQNRRAELERHGSRAASGLLQMGVNAIEEGLLVG